MQAQVPEPSERTGEPQSAVRIITLHMIERGAQVVVLTPQLVEPLLSWCQRWECARSATISLSSTSPNAHAPVCVQRS
jgi:hypothetical protein